MATTTEEEEGDGEGVIYDYDEELKRKWAKELDSKAAATEEEIASHSASVMSAAGAEKKHTNYLDNYNLDDPIDRLAKKINDVLYMLENRPDQIIIAAKSASASLRSNKEQIQRDKTRKTLEFQSKLIDSLK